MKTNLFSAFVFCFAILPVKIQAIVGGIGEDNLDILDFQVSVFNKKLKNLVSSGCIISNKFVLTAASPIRKYNGSDIVIVLASKNLKYDEKSKHEIKQIIYHDKYNDKTKKHNIAILRVREPIKFSKDLHAAKLCQRKVTTDSLVHVGGWGTRGRYKREQPTPFSVIVVKVVDLDMCRKMYKNTHFADLDNTTFCTSTKEGKGACIGDAGAPVVLMGKVVGLVSGGKPCATGTPDVHTMLSVYYSWILDHCLAADLAEY